MSKGKTYEKASRALRCCGLPELPFGDEQFHMVLSAHFLFMYSDRLIKVSYEVMRNGNSLLSIRKT